jgi:hypothetical protein
MDDPGIPLPPKDNTIDKRFTGLTIQKGGAQINPVELKWLNEQNMED